MSLGPVDVMIGSFSVKVFFGILSLSCLKAKRRGEKTGGRKRQVFKELSLSSVF